MDRLDMMETFVRIARTGSLTRAADQLGMSRALVSKHLQRLEAHLGVRLFNRTTRRVALTEIGEDYLAFCNRILAEIGEEERALAYLQSHPRGSLTIHAPMGYGNLQLAPLVAEFMKTYPEIKVTVVLSDASVTAVDLIDRGFDIAVRTGPLEDMNLTARRIGFVRWVLCASPAYLARHAAPDRPQDLAAHDCLVHRKISADGIWHFGEDGEEEAVKVTGSLVTNSVVLLRASVLAGVGVAILPQYCVADDLAAGRLVELLPHRPPRRRPVHLLFAHARYTPRKVRAFVDFLGAHAPDGD